MPLASDAGLLTLAQWLSPAFPVSAFAYSHGLEAAMADGAVTDGRSLRDWIASVIEAGSGRNDAILLCQAMAGTDGVDDLAQALCGSAERWQETRDLGRAFAETLTATGNTLEPAAYPVALGRAAATLDLPPAQVAAHYLLAFAGALVSVGQRYIPLGQAEGQGILSALHPLIHRIAGQAARADLDELGGAVFAADLDATLHQTQSPRMFRT